MTLIQLRRDTAANWTTANPVLAAGEVGVEFTADPGTPEKFKIGDGTTDWATLPYFESGGGGGGGDHPDTDHTDLATNAALSAHAADTTAIHGIADTSVLATASSVATAVSDHSADTTSVHGITDTSTLYRAGGTDVAVADGGTGASTAANARTNLGLVIGTDVAANTHNHAAGDINSGTVATARLGSGTADNTTFLRGDQTWATPAGGSVVYPWQVDVIILMTPTLNVGAWAPAQRAYIYGGIVSNANGALGDNAGWDIVLGAGTWTLEVMRYMGTDSGKETWALDDGAGNFTDLGIIDDYAAVGTGDNLAAITGIVVGSSIKRRLRVTSTAKNASSIGQYLRIQHAQFRRTA